MGAIPWSFVCQPTCKKYTKMDKASVAYCDAIADAKVAPDHKHPLVRYKENCQRRKISQAQAIPDGGETSGRYHGISSSESEEENEVETQVPVSVNIVECNVSSEVAAHPLLLKFYEWLQSPDGGKRDEKTVKQHTSQLFNILKIIDPSEDMMSLLDLKLIRQVFLKGHVDIKKYEAGTIKSYLMSLRHYFSFLLSDRPTEIQFSIDDVHAAREKISMWSASYKRESCTRRWQKLEEDTGNLLTPANIKAFEKSAAAREAVKLIGRRSDPTDETTVTQTAYTLVRDFLFSQIFIDNANRPGVLSYMTMDEYKKMREEGDNYIIAVMKHKTVHVHGPAYIVLSQRLKAWLSVFVEVMRAQVTPSASGPVFLSWNGQRMESNQINKAVQSVFRKAGVSAKVTTTSFRKAAVTKVHDERPELGGKLAGLMAHIEATAKKYYLLSEKAKSSVQASRQLGKLMRGDETTCEEEETKEASENSKSNKDDHDKKKRIPWTSEEEEVLQKSFYEELKEDNISLEVVRKKVETTEQLQGMSPKRVYNKRNKETL